MASGYFIFIKVGVGIVLGYFSALPYSLALDARGAVASRLIIFLRGLANKEWILDLRSPDNCPKISHSLICRKLNNGGGCNLPLAAQPAAGPGASNRSEARQRTSWGTSVRRGHGGQNRHPSTEHSNLGQSFLPEAKGLLLNFCFVLKDTLEIRIYCLIFLAV